MCSLDIPFFCSLAFARDDNNMLMLLKNFNIPTPTMPQRQRDVKIRMVHEVINENGDMKNYDLNLINESSGTQILFSFAPVLKDVFENGKILVIDEIERIQANS